MNYHFFVCAFLIAGTLHSMDIPSKANSIFEDLIKSKIDAGSFNEDLNQATDLIKRCPQSLHGPLLKYAIEKECTPFITALFEHGKNIPRFASYCNDLLKTPGIIFDQNSTYLFLTTIAHQVNISEICACIELLCNAKISLDCSDEYETSALMRYVQWGYYPLIKCLLDHGCDVTYKNMLTGKTALHLASTSQIIELLIQAGASVNATDYTDNTPLHQLAKSHTFPQPIQVLVRAGANINAQNYEGNTPAHEAIKTKNESAILTLLELAADTSLKNNAGIPAIQVTLSKVYTIKTIKFIKDIL